MQKLADDLGLSIGICHFPPRSALVAKQWNTVEGDTSAARAICSMVVASYPCSWKSRRASAWIAARVRTFLRSRSPDPGRRSVRVTSLTQEMEDGPALDGRETHAADHRGRSWTARVRFSLPVRPGSPPRRSSAVAGACGPGGTLTAVPTAATAAAAFGRTLPAPGTGRPIRRCRRCAPTLSVAPAHAACRRAWSRSPGRKKASATASGAIPPAIRPEWSCPVTKEARAEPRSAAEPTCRATATPPKTLALAAAAAAGGSPARFVPGRWAERRTLPGTDAAKPGPSLTTACGSAEPTLLRSADNSTSAADAAVAKVRPDPALTTKVQAQTSAHLAWTDV